MTVSTRKLMATCAVAALAVTIYGCSDSTEDRLRGERDEAVTEAAEAQMAQMMAEQRATEAETARMMAEQAQMMAEQAQMMAEEARAEADRLRMEAEEAAMMASGDAAATEQRATAAEQRAMNAEADAAAAREALRLAQEALAMGLVNHGVPADRLDEKVDWLRERILKQSPTALRHGKNGVHALQDMPLQQAFAFAEANVARMSMTEDAREGFAAFQEKRDPDWPGR